MVMILEKNQQTHRPRTPPKTTRSVPIMAVECPDLAVGDLPDIAGGYKRSMSAVDTRRGGNRSAEVRHETRSYIFFLSMLFSRLFKNIIGINLPAHQNLYITIKARNNFSLYLQRH